MSANGPPVARDLRQTKSFSSRLRGRQAEDDGTQDMRPSDAGSACSAASGSGRAPLSVLKMRSFRASRSFKQSFAQLSLRESLGIEKYNFIKEPEASPCHSPRMSRASRASRNRRASIDDGDSNPDSCLPSPALMSRRESWIASQEWIDAMKPPGVSSNGGRTVSFGGDVLLDSAPSPLPEHFLASMADDARIEASNTIVVSPRLPPAMNRAAWSVKDYKILRSVHKGYASTVYEALCPFTSKKVALKVYVVANMDDIPRVQLAREIRLHSMCNHANIVGFYAAFLEDLQHGPGVAIQKVVSPSGPGRPAATGPDAAAEAAEAAAQQQDDASCRVVVLVVEWAGRGDLTNFIKRQGGVLTEAKAINLVLLPLLKSLHYLHSKGIVHRDLKPENMIFDDDMVLKMADFGLAVDVNDERANTRAGTLDYMAPEVLMCPTKKTPADNKFDARSRHYTTGADAWAVGAILYELLVGTPPFRSSSMSTTARHIVNGEVFYPPQMSGAAQSFISACLNTDPVERPTVLELIEHDLLREMKERASFRIAAMRSNSFVEFIQQQQRMEQQQQQRKALSRQGSRSASAYLDYMLKDGTSDGSGEEDEEEEGDGGDAALVI